MSTTYQQPFTYTNYNNALQNAKNFVTTFSGAVDYPEFINPNNIWTLYNESLDSIDRSNSYSEKTKTADLIFNVSKTYFEELDRIKTVGPAGYEDSRLFAWILSYRPSVFLNSEPVTDLNDFAEQKLEELHNALQVGMLIADANNLVSIAQAEIQNFFDQLIDGVGRLFGPPRLVATFYDFREAGPFYYERESIYVQSALNKPTIKIYEPYSYYLYQTIEGRANGWQDYFDGGGVAQPGTKWGTKYFLAEQSPNNKIFLFYHKKDPGFSTRDIWGTLVNQPLHPYVYPGLGLVDPSGYVTPSGAGGLLGSLYESYDEYASNFVNDFPNDRYLDIQKAPNLNLKEGFRTWFPKDDFILGSPEYNFLGSLVRRNNDGYTSAQKSALDDQLRLYSNQSDREILTIQSILDTVPEYLTGYYGIGITGYTDWTIVNYGGDIDPDLGYGGWTEVFFWKDYVQPSALGIQDVWIPPVDNLIGALTSYFILNGEPAPPDLVDKWTNGYYEQYNGQKTQYGAIQDNIIFAEIDPVDFAGQTVKALCSGFSAKKINIEDLWIGNHAFGSTNAPVVKHYPVSFWGIGAFENHFPDSPAWHIQPESVASALEAKGRAINYPANFGSYYPISPTDMEMFSRIPDGQFNGVSSGITFNEFYSGTTGSDQYFTINRNATEINDIPITYSDIYVDKDKYLAGETAGYIYSYRSNDSGIVGLYDLIGGYYARNFTYQYRDAENAIPYTSGVWESSGYNWEDLVPVFDNEDFWGPLKDSPDGDRVYGQALPKSTHRINENTGNNPKYFCPKFGDWVTSDGSSFSNIQPIHFFRKTNSLYSTSDLTQFDSYRLHKTNGANNYRHYHHYKNRPPSALYFNSAVDEYYHISYTTNRTGLASFERRDPDNYSEVSSEIADPNYGAGAGNGQNEDLIIKINAGYPLGVQHLRKAWQRELGPIAGGSFYYPLYDDPTGGPLNLDGAVGSARVKLNWQAQINEQNIVTSFVLQQQDVVDLYTEGLQQADSWDLFLSEQDLTDLEGIPNLNALNVAKALNSIKYSNFEYDGSILVPNEASTGFYKTNYQQAPLRNYDCQPLTVLMKWGNENTYSSGELDITSDIGIDFRPTTTEYKIVNLGTLPKLFGTPGMSKHLNKHASRYENANYRIEFSGFNSIKDPDNPLSGKFDDFFYNYSEQYGLEISVERRYKFLRPDGTLYTSIGEGYHPVDLCYQFIDAYEVQNGRVFPKGQGKYKYAAYPAHYSHEKPAIKVPYEVEDSISITTDDSWVNYIPQNILTTDWLNQLSANYYARTT